ncbi:hypothetical protein NEFER03_0272 [Nematocida sp. LUAm3]|nr:hypothetical protein NEFER03_0272 [Nematocida sp. LUAm3]KAI5173725.1 hypothetical protein NEFER02_0241 [Nematocida sp. LUAm2]KAI5176947.1 hypothetical protein NEFER01_0272 [Nematocida sp. LUAm1]
MELVAVVIPETHSVYSLVDQIPDDLSVLLIDAECEYAYVSRPARVLNVLVEQLEEVLEEDIEEDVVIYNRIFSHEASALQIQRRMNLLQRIAHSGKKVYFTTEYSNREKKAIRYSALIERMAHVYLLI